MMHLCTVATLCFFEKTFPRNYYYCDQDDNSLGLCFKSMYLTLFVAIFTSNFIFSMFKSFHTYRNINISNRLVMWRWGTWWLHLEWLCWRLFQGCDKKSFIHSSSLLTGSDKIPSSIWHPQIWIDKDCHALHFLCEQRRTKIISKTITSLHSSDFVNCV